jgi:hypothetical protein
MDRRSGELVEFLVSGERTAGAVRVSELNMQPPKAGAGAGEVLSDRTPFKVIAVAFYQPADPVLEAGFGDLG